MPPTNRISSFLAEGFLFKRIKLPRRPAHLSDLTQTRPVLPNSTSPLLNEFIYTSVKEIFNAGTGIFRGTLRASTKAGERQLPRIARRQFGLHHSARPRTTLSTSHRSHQVGLQSARAFSSTTRPLISNVSLGLRAFGDTGLDSRLWRNEVRELRRNHLKSERGRRLDAEKERLKAVNRSMQFGEYFMSTGEFSEETLQSESLRVILSLPLEPLVYYQNFESYSSSSRLISSSYLLELLEITQSYSYHSKLLRRVLNSLIAHGVFESSSAHLLIDDNGLKTVEIKFYGDWDLESVRAVMNVGREEDWFDLQVIDEEDEECFIYPEPCSDGSSIDIVSCDSSPFGSFEVEESAYEAGVRDFLVQLDDFGENSKL